MIDAVAIPIVVVGEKGICISATVTSNSKHQHNTNSTDNHCLHPQRLLEEEEVVIILIIITFIGRDDIVVDFIIRCWNKNRIIQITFLDIFIVVDIDIIGV